jgi:hypothetical protein
MGAYFNYPKSDTPMPLSDTTIRNAKPKEKPYKLFDDKGLFLLINPNGSKYFRFKYRFGGKEKTLALGVYPENSLKDARARRNEAREKLSQNIDPSMERKLDKIRTTEDSFKSLALVWFDHQYGG